MAIRYDNCYRKGDAITFILKNKPYVDLSIPASANDYRNANCVTLAIYDATQEETLLEAKEMTKVPNRTGWYYYRFQTLRSYKTGIYTAIFTVITNIDNVPLTTRSIQEFRLQDDGIV